MNDFGLGDQVSTFALVMSRMAGFVVLSPLPGTWLPKQARVALVVVLSLTLGVSFAPARSIPFGLELAAAAASDFTLGLMIGGAFRLFVMAADFMAGLVAQASWLSVPTSMSPDHGGQGQALGQASILLALLLAIASDVHHVVLAYLLESFRVIPVGAPVTLTAGVLPFVELVGRSFDVGMSLALPVISISLAVQTALALVSRVAPSLQIFSIGFAVLVVTGLVTFMASMRSIAEGILRYYEGLPPFLDEILLRMMGAA